MTPFIQKLAVVVVAVVAVLFFFALPLSTESVQRGYRGTGMEVVVNANTFTETVAANQVPEPPMPLPPDNGGPRAGDVYENVQVLGDLSVTQFNRIMQAITQWVSPDQGCAYCHEGGNFAEDNLYTKVVSRHMIEMTQFVNTEWTDHVKGAGVTCYTCHRGQNVPQYIWFEEPADPQAARMAGSRAGQNAPDPSVAMASLPGDPFTPFLLQDNEIRVQQADEALPAGNRQSIKQTEWTYGLMMHMSESLGVNCTYCHNSRAFGSWEQSPPTRTSAWHGIRMVREINNDHIVPLTDQFPDYRLGPLGDAPKANCGTCHQGLYKPLMGANMVGDYPSLAGPEQLPQENPETASAE
ncbi:MAG: photosynthetic reaction center cytochrome PufC [Azospirillaceae bacterium]